MPPLILNEHLVHPVAVKFIDLIGGVVLGLLLVFPFRNLGHRSGRVFLVVIELVFVFLFVVILA